MKSRISIAGCALATVLFSPPLSYSQSSPIVEYEKARVEFSEVGRQFGVYEACFGLYRRLVESPEFSNSYREIIALKALYQSSGDAQNIYYAFLDRKSKYLNFSLDQMQRLTDFLNESRSRSLSEYWGEMDFLLSNSNGRRQILRKCTHAKSVVENLGRP